MQQERAAHNPNVGTFIHPSTSAGKIMLNDILLWDFELTKNGALKKSQEYLQRILISFEYMTLCNIVFMSLITLSTVAIIHPYELHKG